MQRKSGKLLFEPTGEVQIMEDDLRIPGFVWNDRYLGWRAKYRLGGLRTDQGTYVPAMQSINGSVEFYYVKRKPAKVFQEEEMPYNKMYRLDGSGAQEYQPDGQRADRKTYVEGEMPDNKMYKLDVSYNSYGYCFGDSEFVIEDPSLILQDEYEFADSAEEAEKILLTGITGLTGLDDNGAEMRVFLHAINVNKSGTISYKPGVCALVTNKPLAQFGGNNNFNMPLYYKAKKKTIIY